MTQEQNVTAEQAKVAGIVAEHDDGTTSRYTIDDVLVLMNHMANAVTGYETVVREVAKIVGTDSVWRHRSGAAVIKHIRDTLNENLGNMYKEQVGLHVKTAPSVSNGKGITDLIKGLGEIIAEAQSDEKMRAFVRSGFNRDIEKMSSKYGHTVIGDAVSGGAVADGQEIQTEDSGAACPIPTRQTDTVKEDQAPSNEQYDG